MEIASNYNRILGVGIKGRMDIGIEIGIRSFEMKDVYIQILLYRRT